MGHPCAHEFLSVVTHKRIFRTAAPMALAADAINAWMESPSMHLLGESGRHGSSLLELLTAGQIVGPMVQDARIAAQCLQHGVRELWTADRDFGRFLAPKTVNPRVGG